MHAKLQPGLTVADRYHVGREVARDALGAFWTAVDASANARVTLREIAPELRFTQRDIDSLAERLSQPHVLDHPAAVFPIEILLDGRSVIAVLPPIPGISLEHVRAKCRSGVFEIREFRPIVAQITDAMESAHQKRMVHGGLRSGNIFIDDDGAVRIADFGLGAFISSGALQALDESVRAAATPYMSPAQAKTRGPYQRDDIFAFGVIAYEALTGAIPTTFRKPHWWSNTRIPGKPLPTEHWRRKRSPRPDTPVPPRWENGITACLSFDPFSRPESFALIASILVPGTSAGTPVAAAAQPSTGFKPIPVRGRDPSPARTVPAAPPPAEPESAEEALETFTTSPATTAQAVVASPPPKVRTIQSPRESSYIDELNAEFWDDELQRTAHGRKPADGAPTLEPRPYRSIPRSPDRARSSGRRGGAAESFAAAIGIACLAAAAYLFVNPLDRETLFNRSTAYWRVATARLPELVEMLAPSKPAAGSSASMPAPDITRESAATPLPPSPTSKTARTETKFEAPTRLYAISEVDVRPELIERKDPEYSGAPGQSPAAESAELSVLIGGNGLISAVRVERATSEEFANACVEAVRDWRFVPAIKDGQHVAVWTSLPFKAQ